ncbi:MAG: hypothetical protein ACO3ND_08045, partial [Opitutales bacterium]
MATAYVPRAVGIVASVLLGAGAVGPLVRTMLVEIQLDDVSTGRFHLLPALLHRHRHPDADRPRRG